MDIKVIVSIVAIILVFVGYVPYIIDTVKGTTRPHAFSYFLWALLVYIIFALQLQAGGGLGSWITFTVATVMVVVFALSLKNGKRDIRKVDFIFLAIALLAIPVWLVADQPVLSIILLSTIDMLGFAPTVRKSWVDPWSETLFMYFMTAIRHSLAVIALTEINLVTALFPITWTIANVLFIILLIARRKQLPK